MFKACLALMQAFMMIMTACTISNTKDATLSAEPIRPSVTPVLESKTSADLDTFDEQLQTAVTNQDTAAMQTLVAPTITPTPMPTTASCPNNSQTTILEQPEQTGLLRVLYTVNDQYWLWQEERGTAVSLPIFRENWPLVSPDARNIAFSRTPHEQARELWLMDNDGRNERQVATLTTAETLARYPHEGNDNIPISLSYWWGSNDTLFYRLSPALFIGGVANEAVYQVNVDTGVSQMVIPPGEYSSDFGWSPDNRHAVALTADFTELHLINLANNQVQLKLPIISTIWTFSPDGRYLFVPAQDEAIVVDLVNLSQQTVPFPYRGIGMPGGAVAPPSFWVDETTAIFVISDNSDGPEFTLWRVNLTEKAATPVGSYTGSAHLAAFSPNGQYLAYGEDTGEGLSNLHLVDTATGQDVIYTRDRIGLLFDHWLADSASFIYTDWESNAYEQKFLEMGHICQPPTTIDVLLSAFDLQWADEQRFFDFRGFISDDTGSQSMLYLQSLNGSSVLVGELSAPPDSAFNFLFYFEEP